MKETKLEMLDLCQVAAREQRKLLTQRRADLRPPPPLRHARSPIAGGATYFMYDDSPEGRVLARALTMSL